MVYVSYIVVLWYCHDITYMNFIKLYYGIISLWYDITCIFDTFVQWYNIWWILKSGVLWCNIMCIVNIQGVPKKGGLANAAVSALLLI